MSPDEAAFLKAIADNPADEIARLVYADWLTERDDPRAAFARLSADFLRCVRGMADLRRSLPAEWLGATDPLFNRFSVFRLPPLGEAIHDALVSGVDVVAGSRVAFNQRLFTIELDQAVLEVTAEGAGLITAVLVQPGERVPVGGPMLAYLALPGDAPSVTPTGALERPAPLPSPPPLPTPELQAPFEPLLAFIQALESRRAMLRTVPAKFIDNMISRHTTTAVMAFGVPAVKAAQAEAERHLGWATPAGPLEARLQSITDEQRIQARVDVHIEMLRVLLEMHGHLSSVRGKPGLPGSLSPATG